MRWALLLVLSMCWSCQRPCDRSSCDGCCSSSGECLEGTARLDCGVGGEACQRCTSAERCARAKCEALPVMDGGVVDAGPPACLCFTSCCLPDGACAPNNSIEACGASKRFCGTCAVDQRCEQGTCVAASCVGCLDPLGVCRSGNAVTSCGANGGVCTACGGDQACQAGRCVFTRCDTGNCRFGCCRPDKSCATMSSAAVCGINGDACQACDVDAGQQCLGGACQ